jgi:hypothetical protein
MAAKPCRLSLVSEGILVSSHKSAAPKSPPPLGPPSPLPSNGCATPSACPAPTPVHHQQAVRTPLSGMMCTSSTAKRACSSSGTPAQLQHERLQQMDVMCTWLCIAHVRPQRCDGSRHMAPAASVDRRRRFLTPQLRARQQWQQGVQCRVELHEGPAQRDQQHAKSAPPDLMQTAQTGLVRCPQRATSVKLASVLAATCLISHLCHVALQGVWERRHRVLWARFATEARRS